MYTSSRLVDLLFCFVVISRYRIAMNRFIQERVQNQNKNYISECADYEHPKFVGTIFTPKSCPDAVLYD